MMVIRNNDKKHKIIFTFNSKERQRKFITKTLKIVVYSLTLKKSLKS